MSEVFTYEDKGAGTDNSSISMLDELRAELSAPTPEQTVRLVVPMRPQFKVVYDTRIEWVAHVKRFNRESTENGEQDEIMANALMLASRCLSIELRGTPLKDDSGNHVTFRSKSFIDSTGVIGSTTGAIKKFFERDADIMTSATELMKAAGYGGSELRAEQELDPTDTSNG